MHLIEPDYIVVARQHYFRLSRGNRALKMEKPLLAEVIRTSSYVNKNLSQDFIWSSSDQGALVQKPTEKGERLIIINAITKDS